MSVETPLTAENLQMAADTFASMIQKGISPKNAIALTAEVMGFDKRKENTILEMVLAAKMQVNFKRGMSIESSVRDAFHQFEIQNEEAIQKLIRFHEIEFSRIHDIGKNELIGVGVVGGAKGPDGKPIGAIQIVDGKGESVSREDLQKKD